MVVEISFEKGGIGAIHSHEHEQVAYVKSGIFEFTIGEAVRTIKEGDSLYIEPNTLHGAKAIEAGVIVDVFTPMREDFLK